MRNISSLLSLTIVLLIANAADSADTKSLGEKAMTILEQRCYRCHGGLATFAGVDVLDRASLFGTTDGGESDDALVIKNHASDSRLWQQIESNEMPKLGSEEADAMSDEERVTIERWIDEGAELPFRKVEKPMRNEELFTLIDKFIQSRPIAERRFYRFFSLANLINDETVTVKDLRYTYAALIKVLNSLNHTNPRTIDVLPVADSRGALFAFDLRELGWEDTDNWDFLLKNYTYGVQFDFSETRSLKAVCLNVCQLTGTSQPMIRADWFVVYATQHPIYTKLLAIPETLTGMQQRLGVNFTENIKTGQIARAGFTRSGVSQQNRLIERHEGLSGYVWLSYDFKPRRNRADIARFPLGPKFEGNTFMANAFEHDGGELIFRLPNGLQGYMLIFADGKRLDGPAPNEIVFDNSRVTGTNSIVNGISCINCHREGMITGFLDDIRDARVVGGPAQDLVEKIYPTHESMATLIEADQSQYIAAQNKMLGKILKAEDLAEPVGKVANRYFKTIDVGTAAIELDLLDAKTLQSQIAANRELRALGLARYTQDPPSKLQRAVWEAGDGLSYWQEIISVVHPGAMPAR